MSGTCSSHGIAAPNVQTGCEASRQAEFAMCTRRHPPRGGRQCANASGTHSEEHLQRSRHDTNQSRGPLFPHTHTDRVNHWTTGGNSPIQRDQGCSTEAKGTFGLLGKMWEFFRVTWGPKIEVRFVERGPPVFGRGSLFG